MENRFLFFQGEIDMNAQIREGMMNILATGFGILIYTLLECIDGEKGIRLIPYRVAQHAKMEILMLLERW